MINVVLAAQLAISPGPTLVPRLLDTPTVPTEISVSSVPITVQPCGIRRILSRGLFGAAVGWITGVFATGFFGPDREGAPVTPYVIVGALAGITVGALEAARNGCITRDPTSPSHRLDPLGTRSLRMERIPTDAGEGPTGEDLERRQPLQSSAQSDQSACPTF